MDYYLVLLRGKYLLAAILLIVGLFLVLRKRKP